MEGLVGRRTAVSRAYAGENLFAGIDMAELGYRCTEHISTESAMHVKLNRET